VEPLAIVYHDEVAGYDFGVGHPFRGDRFPRFMDLVKRHGLLSDLRVTIVEPVSASDADLRLVHTEDYICEVERLGGSFEPISGDTPLSPSIVEAARLIVGTSLRAAELVVGGTVNVAEGVGGGLHHAGRGYGGGFCVFNDVAVCAHSLLERHGMERVLVFDTDVHAGNGTMDVFYGESRVLFISVHQDPRTIYPGTGFVDQIGSGPGEGYTVNVPLPPGAGDECMGMVLERVFKPLAREFRPQAIIRNGGSDPHFLDWIGGLNLTYEGLVSIGEAVAEAATEAKCGIIDLCCSGYNPATVAEGWLAILSGVTGIRVGLTEHATPPRVPSWLAEATEDTIDALKDRLGGYWTMG
jgi:acetoin utilization protein AcuC